MAIFASGQAPLVLALHRDDRKRSLCGRMKNPLRFWNYTRRFIVNLNSDDVLCRGVCIARFRDWRNV
jgi:hypothetical protein